MPQAVHAVVEQVVQFGKATEQVAQVDPVELGNNPPEQAEHLLLVQAVQLVTSPIALQPTQDPPPVLGTNPPEQAEQTLTVQVLQLLMSPKTLQATQDPPPVLGTNPPEQVRQALLASQSVQLVIAGLQAEAEAEAISTATAINEKSLFIFFLRIVGCDCF